MLLKIYQATRSGGNSPFPPFSDSDFLMNKHIRDGGSRGETCLEIGLTDGDKKKEKKEYHSIICQ